MIATASDTVVATVPVGLNPQGGVAFTPDHFKERGYSSFWQLRLACIRGRGAFFSIVPERGARRQSDFPNDICEIICRSCGIHILQRLRFQSRTMTGNRHIGLLAELLSVLRKYERSEVQALQNQKWRSEIIKTLDAMVELQNVTKRRNRSQLSKTTKRNSREYFQAFVSHLREHEDSRSGQIAKLIERITTRKVLQNSGALREFAASLNIKASDTKLDRWSVARRIGEALTHRTDEDISRLVELTEHFGGEKSSLQAWSDVIVKK